MLRYFCLVHPQYTTAPDGPGLADWYYGFIVVNVLRFFVRFLGHALDGPSRSVDCPLRHLA